MNWFTNLTRPGFKKRHEQAEKPEDDKSGPLWVKCPTTGELVYLADLEAAQWVTPAGFHMRIGPQVRFKHLFDDAAFERIALPEVPKDPLKFKDDKRYGDRLKAARAKVSRDDCMDAAFGRIGGAPAVVLVQDFEFMGGSLGMAAGEAFVTAARAAVARGAALICVTASGGARMQEGVLSLMQMPRTTLAIQELKAARRPYIVILTDPTSGGVTASYAMLGDVQIAEPGAMIAFSGPRVIEQTIRQKLPEGFQRAEYLHEKGMIDLVIDRRELAPVLGQLLGVLMLVAAFEAVGTLLSVGLLVLPAAAARYWSERLMPQVAVATGVGAAASAGGLAASALFALPGGACVILAAGAFYLASVLFGPIDGLVSRAFPKRHYAG